MRLGGGTAQERQGFRPEVWGKDNGALDQQAALHDYIADSVRQPAPGQGKCGLVDPLFEAIRSRPLLFEQADEGRIRELIERRRGLLAGRAVKLMSADP